MKALMCHNFYLAAGGEDQVFRDECALLQSHGHEVVPYQVHNKSLAALSPWEAAKTSYWNADTYDQVLRLIRAHAPDVVHCANTFPLMSPSVYYAAAAEQVPVVQTLHNFRMFCPAGTLLRNEAPCESCLTKSFAWPAIVHRCYRGSLGATTASALMHAFHRLKGTWEHRIDQYIALSEFSRNKFITAGIPAEKIVVKPNFVDPDPGFHEVKQAYAIFVGRLSPEKGIGVLLNAWKTLGKRIPLKIIGEGPLSNKVQQHCCDHPGVEWLGSKPFEETLRWIAAARLLVFPSIWYETFGRSMIEAKAAGTPVVASNLGAMAELNSHGDTGLLFDPGNAADLRAKVEMLLEDDALSRSIALSGRSQFDQLFTASHNLRGLLDVYRRARVHSIVETECCTS